jgi:hypothetical protein
MPLPPAVATINRAVGVISVLVGLAFFLVGGYFVHHNNLDVFVLKSGVAAGCVIENEKVRRTDRQEGFSHTSYRAIIEFPDQAGHLVRYRDWISFNPASFYVGQTVRIFYDPQNPEHAMVDRGPRNYFVPLVILVFGGLSLLGGLQRLSMRTPRPEKE